MGKILLYTAGRAAIAQLCNPSGTTGSGGKTNVHPWKDVEGTEFSTYYNNTSSTNNLLAVDRIFSNYNPTQSNALQGYASADTEEDFSLDHYTTREIADLSYSRSETAQTAGRVITMQVTNNGASSVDVGSLKFTKKIVAYSGSSTVDITALVWGYFLDTPVTIGVGETKTFALNFDT